MKKTSACAVFEGSQWIWLKDSSSETDEYGDFTGRFTAETDRKTILRICAKSDYAVFLNGHFVGFNQFGDFPDEKVYDEYDVSDKLVAGENILAVLALSKNYDTSSHIKNGKGIIFEVKSGEELLLVSDEKILSRKSKTYLSGGQPLITGQLGMSFGYDFKGEDGWIASGMPTEGFSASAISDEKGRFIPRPVKRMDVSEKLPFRGLGGGLYDAGRECVGYLFFDIESEEERELVLSYGEHIADGRVRRKIGPRDFSVRFFLKKGRNVFRAYFLRFGLRYLQFDEAGIKVREIGIYAARYPVSRAEYEGNAVPRDIYDAAVYTLECCMHEHYEDCPWREQAQYTMDSRTQMLCGYYAFHEMQMPAAALRTMAHRLTSQGVFPITSPCATELSIPSFSLVYPLMLREYYSFSGDKSVLEDVYENTRSMLEHYISERIDGLVPTLAEWNFFEWSEGSDNDAEISKQSYNGNKFALPVNAFFINALENFAFVSETLGRSGDRYRALAESTREKAREAFSGENGLFYTYNEGGKRSHLSEYGQVFALYSGMARGAERQKLLRVITTENELVPLTVSNYIFKYEVLLAEGGYEEYIAADVSEKWGYMLKNGATTFWETIKGEADFDGAGSLCHGWSAVPVYVAWRLEETKSRKK